MAQGRRRPPKPTRKGSSKGSGVRTAGLWLVLLALAGVAIVAARTLKLPLGQPSAAAEPTLGIAGGGGGGQAPTPTHTASTAHAASTAVAEPTHRPTAAPTAPPTAVRVRVTPAAPRTPLVAVAPTAASVGAVGAVATPTSVVKGVAGVTPAAAASAARTPTSAALRPPEPTAVRAPDGPAATAGSVALTFDAGADRGYAEDILDLLAEQHILASFGITGQWAKANPDLVRRIAADGHLVVNHTLDHRSFTGVSDQLGGLSATRRRAELEDADAIIAPLIGHSTRPWYRLPYGDDDAHVAADVESAGYSRKVGWTVDSLGWKGMQSTDIVARCLRLAAAGGVYIFHVGRQSQDAIALPQVISGLRDRGLGFVRVDAS